MEGFYQAGSIAQRNNNPGNLRSGTGQVGTAGGFAVFPDAETGWAALVHQVYLNIERGLSLFTFFGGERYENGSVIPGGYPGYAPSGDSNNPNQYANFVASQVGIDPSTPLNSIGASPPDPSMGRQGKPARPGAQASSRASRQGTAPKRSSTG